jgi:hypothetical protein
VSFFLCWPVLYTTAPIVQTARGVLVYICVSGPYGLYTAHRGPCIANYIPTLLGFEEYIGNYSPNIQQITPRLFPPNPNEHVLTKTLLLLWYIWKARNDQRFQRKTWSPLQVHQAAAAHFQWGGAPACSHNSATPTPHPSTQQGQTSLGSFSYSIAGFQMLY